MAMQTVPNEDMTKQRLRKEGGAWLRHRRETVGLSQRELAECVEVGYYTFVSQIEAGRGRIPAERYRIWADALKMDGKEFVRNIMAFYEPTTYQILFSDEERA